MTKYQVRVPEVQICYTNVEADSPEEALEMVRDGCGEIQAIDYSHTLDFDIDSVEEVTE